MKIQHVITSFFASLGIFSGMSFTGEGSSASNLREENITYTSDGTTMKGFVVYDDSKRGKRPAVLVVHEWWGLNDYARMRARKLAELGYIAMAVDMFGNGKTAANPQEAQQLTGPFYKDPQLAKKRLDAAIAKIKQYPQTDASQVAAVGYCFGGSVVLNSAKLGSDLKGVVSFHGGLAGGAPASKNMLKAKVLICYGDNDQFVPRKDLDAFKHQLDSIHADYVVKEYPGAMHAFTNPDATSLGKQFNLPIAYNPDADENSWNDMKLFFGKINLK